MAEMPDSLSQPPTRVRVLVADDDDGIRSLLGMILPRAGFTIDLAATGEEAVEIYQRHGKFIHLVLSDVLMGAGLDGPQTIAAIRQMNHGARFCFMSGGTGKYSTADLLALGALWVFTKPIMDMTNFAAVLKGLASGAV